MCAVAVAVGVGVADADAVVVVVVGWSTPVLKHTKHESFSASVHVVRSHWEIDAGLEFEATGILRTQVRR